LRVTFRWQATICVIEVGPPEMLDEISQLFPGCLVEESGSSSADVTVTADPSGFRVVPGPEEVHLHTSDAVSAVEYAVTMHLLRSDTLHAHLHGAAALTPFGAVIATGRSGVGKSTLAYTWAHQGLPIFGDDVVPVDPEGRIHTFPRLLKVDPTLLRMNGEVPEHSVAWDPDAEDTWWSPMQCGGWADHSAPAVVVADVHYREGAALRSEAVEGGEKLRLLLNAIQVTGTPPDMSIDRLIRVTETAKIVRLEFGNADDAASWLCRMADRSAAD
jgi:hypothetical protein